jgi:hypothetical protein
MKPGANGGDVTTMDMMYSYENTQGKGGAAFSEEIIKKMTGKLRAVRNANSERLDPEIELKAQQLLESLNAVQTHHADYYAQK